MHYMVHFFSEFIDDAPQTWEEQNIASTSQASGPPCRSSELELCVSDTHVGKQRQRRNVHSMKRWQATTRKEAAYSCTEKAVGHLETQTNEAMKAKRKLLLVSAAADSVRETAELFKKTMQTTENSVDKTTKKYL